MLSLFHSWVTEAIHDILPSSDIQTALFSHGSNLLRLTLKASALTISDLEKLLTRIRYLSTQKAKEAPIIAATAPFQEEEKLDTLSISCLQFLNIHLLFKESLIWYRILPPASQTFTEKIMKEIEAFRAAISNRHFAAAEDILSAFYLTNIFPITRQKFWNILYVKLAILCAVFLFVINWAQNEVFFRI